MSIALLIIDTAKSVFQLHIADEFGNSILRRKVTHTKLAETMQNLPPRRTAMESCGGARYRARRFQTMSHLVQLIAPQLVVPFRNSNKSDSNDAEAIREAV